MEVLVAKHAGFCFGVRRIDQKAQEALAQKGSKKLYSYGPLVHNPQYVEKRKSEGIQVLEGPQDLGKLDPDSLVLLRAHGVKKAEREAIQKTGAQVIDGTCPVLLKIYQVLAEKEAQGLYPVIIGDPRHPEVQAMVSYLKEGTVLSTLEEAQAFQRDQKLFVVSQTTNRADYFSAMVDALRKHNALEVKETICQASRLRQEAALDLAKQVDWMLVLGGHNSSNTEKLRQMAAKVNKHVEKVEEWKDLTLQKGALLHRIGITAGASTPDWIIEEVVRGMENFTKEDFMEQIEDSMVKIYPRDIVKGTVISVKDDEVYIDIRYRADGIIKSDEMTDEERANPHDKFHEGDEVDVYVIKLDDGEGNVSLSTRRVEGLKNWQKLVEKYEAGETVEAMITGENRGGLVASVMGINGFIPASHIATHFVKNFKQFVGQSLETKFLSIDERKRRVVLSARAVLEEQLDEVWEKIVVGQTVKGKVVRMTDFGAFVDLGGVDGLIHVSDISWQRIEKPSDVLKVGQEVEPVVLKANRERNRISLGLKQLTPKPFELFKEQNKAGDVVKGTIVNLLDFGAFVRLSEGVEGLIHVSQISHRHVEKPSDEFNVGQEVEVKILEIDEERQRIALSTRALEEAPAKAEEAKEEKASKPQYDPARFERRDQQPAQKPKQPRERRKPVAKLADFDSSSDIGTNLGDLIAAQLNLVSEDLELPEEAPAQESDAPLEEAPVEESAAQEEPAEGAPVQEAAAEEASTEEAQESEEN